MLAINSFYIEPTVESVQATKTARETNRWADWRLARRLTWSSWGGRSGGCVIDPTPGAGGVCDLSGITRLVV